VIPTFHSFEIACPPGWTVQDAPDCLAVFLAPDDEAADFRPNLLIGADRLPEPVELADVAQVALAEAAASFNAYAIDDEQWTEVAGEPTVRRVQSFTVPEVRERLVQLEVLLLAPRRSQSTRELFRIHATATAAQRAQYADTFTTMVGTFVFVDLAANE